MTALAMALVAGMGVGSDGQERISTETQERFLGSGYWEGVMFPVGDEEPTVKVMLQPGLLIAVGKGRESCKWVDEGRGLCRVISENGISQMAIYKRGASGQLILCINIWKTRPNRFQRDEAHTLLILHPSQPPRK